MLEIRNYSLEYFKGKKVIDDLSLTVREGDIYAFVGRNGAGKTTTIKSIVGINHITDGDILLDGVSIQKNPLEFKNKIAYIPDNPALYDNLTGIQYLNFIADMHEVTEKDRIKRIKEYAKKFELYDELGDVISSYSHGMKQKLVLISAFIHDPKLYILDEPFVGLDPKASFTLKEILKEKAADKKIIFFSTHVLDVAEKLCNKIAIIKNGKIIESGDTLEVKGEGTLEDKFMEIFND
jgi:ABC-2 type transport system ATP-binding protein